MTTQGDELRDALFEAFGSILANQIMEVIEPLYTRAQDAAGKGVDDDFTWWRVEVSDHGGQIVAIEQSLADGVLSGREIGEREEAFVIAAIEHLSGFIGHPAKPAQVGEKYRPFTMKDVERLYRFIGAEGGHSYDAMFKVLDDIGAVVPAQEGGV
jgi:hypothetical protein